MIAVCRNGVRLGTAHSRLGRGSLSQLDILMKGNGGNVPFFFPSLLSPGFAWMLPFEPAIFLSVGQRRMRFFFAGVEAALDCRKHGVLAIVFDEAACHSCINQPALNGRSADPSCGNHVAHAQCAIVQFVVAAGVPGGVDAILWATLFSAVRA